MTWGISTSTLLEVTISVLPIGRRLQQRLDADRTARAGLVLHDDRLLDVSRQLLRQQARHHIHRTTGGGGHDQFDGLVGPGPGCWPSWRYRPWPAGLRSSASWVCLLLAG